MPHPILLAFGPLFYGFQTERIIPGDGHTGIRRGPDVFCGPRVSGGCFPMDHAPPRQTSQFNSENCVGECGSSRG